MRGWVPVRDLRMVFRRPLISFRERLVKGFMGSRQWHKGGAALSFFVKFTQARACAVDKEIPRRKCKAIRMGEGNDRPLRE